MRCHVATMRCDAVPPNNWARVEQRPRSGATTVRPRPGAREGASESSRVLALMRRVCAAVMHTIPWPSYGTATSSFSEGLDLVGNLQGIVVTRETAVRRNVHAFKDASSDGWGPSGSGRGSAWSPGHRRPREPPQHLPPDHVRKGRYP